MYPDILRIGIQFYSFIFCRRKFFQANERLALCREFIFLIVYMIVFDNIRVH